MKLIVAVLRKEDEADTIAELNKKGFFVTELATTGGFLKEKNTTLRCACDLKTGSRASENSYLCGHPDGKRKLLPGRKLLCSD